MVRRRAYSDFFQLFSITAACLCGRFEIDLLIESSFVPFPDRGSLKCVSNGGAGGSDGHLATNARVPEET